MYATPRRERADAAAYAEQPPTVLECVTHALNALLRHAEQSSNLATRADDSTAVDAPLVHSVRAAAYSEAAHLLRDALDSARHQQPATVEPDTFEHPDAELRAVPVPLDNDGRTASEHHPYGTAVALPVESHDSKGNAVAGHLFGTLMSEVNPGDAYANVAAGAHHFILPAAALRYGETFAHIVTTIPVKDGDAPGELLVDWDAPLHRSGTPRLRIRDCDGGDTVAELRVYPDAGQVRLTVRDLSGTGAGSGQGVDLSMRAWALLDQAARNLFARMALDQQGK